MKYNKIILIGMMGCGKSTIARKLAEELSLKFFECDEIFEKKFKISIMEYFKKYGEKQFRIEENIILKEVMKNDNYIISTGGGAVLSKENRELIFDKNILSIYIKTNPDIIFNRIKNDKSRPLLTVLNPKEEIIKILENREKFYNQAKLIIENNTIIKKAIEDILKCIIC